MIHKFKSDIINLFLKKKIDIEHFLINENPYISVQNTFYLLFD